MKKVLALVAFAGFLTFGMSTATLALDEENLTEVVDSAAAEAAAAAEAEAAKLAAEKEAEDKAAAVAAAAAAAANSGEFELSTELKTRFIEGGAGFMGIVLLCLILGLALIIERIVYLNLATTNTKSLLEKIEQALASGGVDAAKEVCRNTRGPVASIFYQWLDRSEEGIEMGEKSVVAYGGVQMGLMEK
jgi:biopolymer transport protein ExbB